MHLGLCKHCLSLLLFCCLLLFVLCVSVSLCVFVCETIRVFV